MEGDSSSAVDALHARDHGLGAQLGDDGAEMLEVIYLEIDAFGAELVDRFGPLPEEVEHLLQIVAIKALCRRANVEKIEAGPKGAVITFRDNTFANPEGLLGYIREQGSDARVRPDMKVVFFDEWSKPEQRLKGTMLILRRLATIAERAKAA
jgi:transcription-repair coupling factor (superfamily II helicase)